jgi:hypothetical protein
MPSAHWPIQGLADPGSHPEVGSQTLFSKAMMTVRKGQERLAAGDGGRVVMHEAEGVALYRATVSRRRPRGIGRSATAPSRQVGRLVVLCHGFPESRKALAAWVRALSAPRRATRKARRASTAPSLDLGAPEASPFNAALAAASASVGSDLPRRRRTWRLGLMTSSTARGSLSLT